MIATMTGDSRRAHGLFLGLAEDPANRPAAAGNQIEFLGLIDLQDTVIGRKARNTGHKAIRARAVTDLANYIGWEKSHGVFYMGVPDMAVGPLYYSLYDAASRAHHRRVPRGCRQEPAKHTNQTPLSPGEVEDMLELLMTADGDTVWDLITAHLKNGKSIQSLGDTIQLGAAELILRTTVAAAVHQRPAPVRLLQRRQQLDAHQQEPVQGAHPLSDGQLHQRRGAREQAALSR